MIGQTISHYRIVEKLGSGGMGVVYKAEDTTLRRAVALKFPPVEKLVGEEEKLRFVREAQAAAALNHPNICTVYEIGESDEHIFIAMEFVEGESVKDKARARPLPLEEALDIARQAAQGLQAAHEKGIVHRDIKSANLMVTAQGQVKVMDFGLAQVGDRSHLTKTGTTLGTPAYMSPEQAQALPTDCRSDIWSLGVVFYEVLTGQLPFKGEVEAAIAYAVVNTEPEPPTALRSGMPVELDYIVGKALAKRQQERYQHIEDMLVDLRAAQSGGAVKRGPRPRKLSRRAVIGTGAGAAVAIGGAAGFVAFFGNSPIDSLAVLPFVNAAADRDTDYLSDGISESLITGLSRLPDVRVMSRNTAFRYKGQDTDARQIGRELGVRAVLTGRLTQRGDSLSVSAELVNTSDGAVLWANQYNRPAADILSIDQDILREITEQLRLTAEQQQQSGVASTHNPEAYRLYLQGRYLWNRRPEGLTAAAEYFQQAVDRDPDYALAWAGLADSFLMLGGWGLMPPPEAFPDAGAAANRAIQMEETLAEPHATLGYLKTLYEWDWPGAEREFRRAIELNPEYGTAHHWYAFYLQSVGLMEDALAQIRRARDAEPLSPIINAEVAYFHVFARQYEQAVREAQRALKLDPTFPSSHRILAHAYALQGNREQARAEVETVISQGGVHEVAGLGGQILAFAGYTEEARKLLAELTRLSETQYVFPAMLGISHAILGDLDQAFDYFDQALAERSMVVSWLRDPMLDSVADDPRFRGIFERMGLRP